MSNTTRILDGFVPDVWASWMAVDTTEKTDIFTSGIIRTDGDLAGKLSGGGRTFNAPFWKDLSNSEPNKASDDPAIEATPEKLTSGKDVVRRQVATWGISTADLTPVVTGGDPLGRMREAFGRYWSRHFQRVLVKTLTGVFADNAANDSGDMTHDVSTDSSATITDAELISAEAIMDAAQTMGDRKDAFNTLIMHSDVQTRLAKDDLISTIRDSEGRVLFQTYLGYRLIIDDGVRKQVAGVDTTNRNKYDTYLCGSGAVAWAETTLPMPAEVERKPAQGNGMGVEVLWNRRQYAMHVPGIKWAGGADNDEFPSYADLANASNWDRVYPERKQIPLALLRTNG